ncbi:MAG: hypothetical protein ACM3SQ_05880 [Betaproteobacteria bacterium]
MMVDSKGDGVKCPRPIDAAVLADYWLAALADPEEAAVEEHLLACDECGDRLRDVIALADGVRRLAREGCLRMVVSDAFVQRAGKDGLQIREYAASAGGSVHCTVTADDDILIGRLAADLSGATRVDLSLCDDRGIEQMRLADIPVHAGAGSVIYQESITLLKAAPDFTLIARLVTVDEGGRERLLGEYTFEHARSLPGRGAW